MTHFNWTQLIPGVGHEYVHVATAAVATLLIIVLCVIGNLALGKGDAAIAPAGKLGIKAFFEMVVELIVYLNDMVIGKEKQKLVPFFGGFFVFIWINNMLGLVPGMTAATDNINTTVSLGLFSFLAYNAFGVKENGLGYFKHFLGPLLVLAPLMLPIEIISHLVRPLSLGLRLKGNMTGDHTVLGIFLDLVPIGVPMIFYCLGMFVCFVQAFVFTLLSMVYTSMATAHDH